MSKARLIITAVIMEGRSQHEVARAYGVPSGLRRESPRDFSPLSGTVPAYTRTCHQPTRCRIILSTS